MRAYPDSIEKKDSQIPDVVLHKGRFFFYVSMMKHRLLAFYENCIVPESTKFAE